MEKVKEFAKQKFENSHSFMSNRKKVYLTTIWVAVFLYLIYLLLNIGRCDYSGACTFQIYGPIVFPFFLFLIWKPGGRKWSKQIAYGLLYIFVVFLLIFILDYIS